MPARCSTTRSTSATPPTPPTCSSGSRTTRRATASSRPKGRSCCSTISPASICPTIPASSTRCGRRCRGCISMAASCRDRRVERWAAGIADLVREHGGGNRRIAVDHLDHEGVAELARLGVSVGNGEAVMENARLIKSPDEILCMRRAIVACEAAMARDAGGAETRHLRERAVGRTAPRQHRARRRVDRDAAAVVRPAHQSVVPGMLLAHHRGRRPRRLRHRPDRPLRLLRRPVAHLALRRRKADQTSSATSSASPPTRSPTTPS